MQITDYELLWGLSRLLETKLYLDGGLGFGAARAMDIFGRRRIDRPQKKAVSLCWNERFIIWGKQ